MNNERVHEPNEPVLWSEILVRGPDAASFLQGQLSQDLTEVTPGETSSLLLAPNSDVLCTCRVRPIDDGFSLVLARELGELALARLRRFHLRVACTLELVDVEVGPYATLDEQLALAEPGPREFVGLSPQSYGGAFVARHVSFSKGCFTGQELVARMDARGSSVPWRFVVANGPSIERIDGVLRARGPEGPSGATTAVRRADGVAALGFIHRSALDDASTSPDVRVTVIA